MTLVSFKLLSQSRYTPWIVTKYRQI